MRIAEADILMAPGAHCGPDHWMSRWERRMPTAVRIAIAGRQETSQEAGLIAHAQSATRPVIVIAHSCGVLHAVRAAPLLRAWVRGVFLAAPPDPQSPAGAALCREPAAVPLDPLPFPSLVVASRSDPHCSFERAEHFAQAWGSLLIDAGDAGELDAASGRGPWPEGLLLFSRLLRDIAVQPLVGSVSPA